MGARLLLALDAGVRSPLRKRDRLGLSAQDVRRAELLLERFFRFHIGIELRSAPFLREVVSVWVDAGPPAGQNAPSSASGGKGAGLREARRSEAATRIEN